MINVIAMFMCTVAAIVTGVKGFYLLCVLNALFAVANLPFAIKWVRSL